MFSINFQTLKDTYQRVLASPKAQKLKVIGQRIFGYLVLRLQEPSSWRGIVLIMTATGSAVKPNFAYIIMTFGMLAAGLVGMIFPDAVKQAEEVDHSHGGGYIDFGGYGYGHGEGSQSIDNPDAIESSTGTKRAPR